MKIFILLLIATGVLGSGTAVAKDRLLTDLRVIPTSVLQRSISPKFYKSLLISPIEGWVIVRGNLAGTRLAGSRVIHSELKRLYDPLALQLANEVVIAGNNSIEHPNTTSPVLVHVLVYQIADGTMVLSFAHIDEAGGNQMEYFGCARLLVLKDDKWTEIKGPTGLQGKGLAVRQGARSDLARALKTERIPGGASNGSNGQAGY